MKPQKKGAKPAKTNSNPKREGKKTPAPTPAPAPKKPSGKASKPSRGRVKVDRAEASVEVEAGGAAPKKAAEKPAPAPAPAAEEPSLVAPAKKAERAARAPTIEDLVPGEAIAGVHLARCVRYAAGVTPKEDGDVYFTHDDDDRPVVSGHDLKRSHTGFLPPKAAMLCDIAVDRGTALDFASFIEGLSGPMVRIDEAGTAHVRHGVGQPPVTFELGHRAITQKWRPPSQHGRAQAAGPLRISASAQSKAVRWPEAVVHTFQSADGIEWNDVSDAESGLLLARAVLAEDGRDLYAEDGRQVEIPGARRVFGPAPTGGEPGPVVRDLKDVARECGELLAAQGAEVASIDGAKPAAPPKPAFPSLDEGGLVELRIDLKSWEALPAAVRGAINEYPWVVGRTEGSYWVLAPLNASEVAAVASALELGGMRCSDTMGGTAFDTWFVAPATPAPDAPAAQAEPEASAPAVEATDAAVAPAEEAEAFPAPGERRVVFEVPDALWQELSPETIVILHQPRAGESRVTWFNREALVVSAATEAEDAAAIGLLLGALGLACVEPRAGVQDQGLEVDVWAVGRRAERQGAAA